MDRRHPSCAIPTPAVQTPPFAAPPACFQHRANAECAHCTSHALHGCSDSGAPCSRTHPQASPLQRLCSTFYGTAELDGSPCLHPAARPVTQGRGEADGSACNGTGEGRGAVLLHAGDPADVQLLVFSNLTEAVVLQDVTLVLSSLVQSELPLAAAMAAAAAADAAAAAADAAAALVPPMPLMPRSESLTSLAVGGSGGSFREASSAADGG
eukprot:351464-Chlamydomonas_euryale.AAC.2